MSFSRKKKTVKEKKKYDKNSKRYELHKKVKLATLGLGDSLIDAVKLPSGEDVNEWFAVHVIDFFNQTNLLYGSVAEFCTNATCPKMSAGNLSYLWQDETMKKPEEVSAPQYVESLFSWILKKIDNDNIFPTTVDKPFPPTFKIEVMNIFKRLFRVFAHIYVHHFTQVQDLNEEAHLNTTFKHFIYFSKQFNLIDEKEFSPLTDLMKSFKLI